MDLDDLLAAYTTRHSRYARAASLSRVELTTVTYVHLSGPVTARAISDRLSQSSGGVTKIVDRLILRGLLARQAHPFDRRSVLIAVTELGQRTALGFTASVNHAAQRAVEGDPEAAEWTGRILQSLTASLGQNG